MKCFSLLVLAGLLTHNVSAAASTPEDFERAVKEKGPEYIAARDKLLQPDADVSFIKGKLQSDSPRERLTAQIIMGWGEHKDEFSKLLGETVVDQRGEKRFPWSYEPEAIKPNYLPLMYELLLKEIGSSSARDAAVRVINYLARQGTNPDVKALIEVMRQDATPEPTRAAVARTVSTLPRTLVKADDLVELLENEATRSTKSQEVAGNLMNGLIRLGSRLPEENKDAIVDRLLGMDNLRALVGETPVVYTVGGIGGNRAASRVAKFLDQAEGCDRRMM